MAEELDQSAEDAGASAETPASSNAVDLDAVMAALGKKIDERFSGFQSLIDKKVSPLASQLEELKTAGMSPEEREQLEEEAAKSRVSALERENQLLKLRTSEPDAVDFLMALESAESFEDQLALVKSKFGAGAAAQVEAAVEAAEGETTPAVDPNNPARPSQQGIVAGLSGEMNEQIADALMEGAKGRSLASFRRQPTG